MCKIRLAAAAAAVASVCSLFSSASRVFSATDDFSTFVFESSASVYHGGDVFAGCGDRTVALTFDDGPHPRETDEILAVLDEYGVKATFFEIGCNVRLYPEVTARVIAAGHEVGNHTDSHKFLRGYSEERIEKEIRAADDSINEVCPYKTRFLRPPGGIYDSAVVAASKYEDKVLVLWTIDTLDWNHRSCRGIVDEVLDNVKGGDIILMHDYVSGEVHTAEALKIIIPELLSRGFEFVTMSDMYELRVQR